VRFAAEKIAQIKNTNLEEVVARTGANACRLFGLT
jgi:Tat protein secretion system quality control protein TatD with DNase activity